MPCLYELFFPLEGPGSCTGVEIPEKWGKILKNSPPRSDPRKIGENGENCAEKGVKLLRKYDFCLFFL